MTLSAEIVIALTLKLSFTTFFWSFSVTTTLLAADLYEKLEQKKILIRDCSNYTGLSKGYYRVAVKKHEENQQLVRALKEIDRTKVENVIL